MIVKYILINSTNEIDALLHVTLYCSRLSLYCSYMNQIYYCKTIYASYLYHFYTYIHFFYMSVPACRCVPQYQYHSTLPHLLPPRMTLMRKEMKKNHFNFPSLYNVYLSCPHQVNTFSTVLLHMS